MGSTCLRNKLYSSMYLHWYAYLQSPIDKPLFYPVELLANLLRKPGSKLIIPTFLVLAAFDKLPFISGYYAFYGSFINLKTGKQYSCAIEILADIAVFPMSKRQVCIPLINLQPT